MNREDGVDTSLAGLHFSFIVYNDPNVPACAFKNIGFSTARALTRSCKLLNDLVSDSYVLKMDKDILFGGVTIAAGTNLMTYPAFKDHWEKSDQGNGIARNSGEIYGKIKLDESLYNQIDFTTGKYNVELSFETTDGQNLSQQLDVVYKL